MSAFKNATAFFHACEGLEGWQGCKKYVAPDARFVAQCEPIVDVSTVEAYCDWMAGLGRQVLPGCSYDLHASAYSRESRTALFFATFTGKHTGEGGPVPPTLQQTSSHYVYALTMDDDDHVARMVKIWNAPWAMRELGWVN